MEFNRNIRDFVDSKTTLIGVLPPGCGFLVGEEGILVCEEARLVLSGILLIVTST